MSKREARLVELALAILQAESRRHGGVARTDGVRLALRVLLRHVDQHTLTSFWNVMANDKASEPTTCGASFAPSTQWQAARSAYLERSTYRW